MTWEQPAFARQERLSRAIVAAAVTLDDRWTDEVADGVALLCEQWSWCWPRAIRLSWPLDVPATLARRELDDPLLRDIWGETVTRIDLAAGQRTELTVTAEADAPSDKDGR